MSDEDDLKAEVERLRNENAALKKGAPDGIRMKGKREGSGLGLRNGTLSGDLI
jgi:hypothetical protein